MEKIGDLIGSIVTVAIFLLLVLIIMNVPKVFKKRLGQLGQQHASEAGYLLIINIIFMMLYNLVFVIPLGFFFEFQETMPRGFWNSVAFLSTLYVIMRFSTSIYTFTSTEGTFKDAGTDKTRIIPEDKPIAIIATFLSLPVLVAGNIINGYLIIRFDSFLLGFAMGQGVEMIFLMSYIVVAYILTILRMIVSENYRQKKEEANKRWFIAKIAKEISGATLGGYSMVRRDYAHPTD